MCGGSGLTLAEVDRAARLIYANVEKDANVIFGALVDDSLGDSVSMTVLATGFKTKNDKKAVTTTTTTTTSTRKNVYNDVLEGGYIAEKTVQPVVNVKPQQSVRRESVKEDTDDVPDFLKRLKRKR